ncbi:MAG: hypothetical protein NTV28_07530 [Propionibacteriales bacterium]|nr:hypothetical protein [Propionibacteriales bacterium]
MTGVLLARVHGRHVLLRGASPRIALALAGLVGAVAASGAVFARSRWRDEVSTGAVLVPPSLVLAVGLAIVVLDQTAPRGVHGPLLTLPVGRRAAARLQRLPGLLALGLLVLVCTPALLLLLSEVGTGYLEASLMVAVCVVAGVATGLLCSVVASGATAAAARLGVPAVVAAPLAALVWTGWTLATVGAVGHGLLHPLAPALAVWPRVLDVMTGGRAAVDLGLDLLLWTVLAGLLLGAVRPDPGLRGVWGRRRFRRVPLLVLQVTRVLRARPTQVHLLMGTSLLAVLGVAPQWRPEVGPSTGGVVVAALVCAVAGVALRGLDGVLPLDVRWLVTSWRHVGLALGGVLVCTAPLILVGLALSSPSGVGMVLVPLVLCVAATGVGLAVGAVLGAPAGDPVAELGAVGALATVALVLGGGADPAALVTLLSAVTVAAVLVGVRAENGLLARTRRGDVDPPPTSEGETG